MTPLNLRQIAAGRYRTSWDPATEMDGKDQWLARIPCRRGGFIGVHSDRLLCAYTQQRGLHARLLAIQDVTARQHGDTELIVTFPPERLDAVAEVLRARRAIQLSDEERDRRSARMRRVRVDPRMKTPTQTDVGHEISTESIPQGIPEEELAQGAAS